MIRLIVSVVETFALLLAAGAILLLLVASPTSRSADQGNLSPTIPVVEPGRLSSEPDYDVGAAATRRGISSQLRRPGVIPELALTQAVGTALVAGWATYYDDGPGLYGAVPGYRQGHPYYVCVRLDVQLHADLATCGKKGSHSVVVRVRDFCACGDRSGRPTIIDLSPAAFKRLAPLTQGVVRVTVESPWASKIPLPPTDTAP
jgi:Lytic transglycolase